MVIELKVSLGLFLQKSLTFKLRNISPKILSKRTFQAIS
jgi:hypothetical protein